MSSSINRRTFLVSALASAATPFLTTAKKIELFDPQDPNYSEERYVS